MERVGFIGLGIMGRPMARNILKAGYALCVYNRSRPAVDKLVTHGATSESSPKDLAAKSDVVITMVPDTPDVKQVLFGLNGVVHGARPGLIVVDMSTISPTGTREMAARLKAKGVSMLDAPVTGGEQGAISGTLSIMVGGEKLVFDHVLPILRAMGSNVVYIGPSGTGQSVKLANQMIAALNILGMSEGMMFLAKTGIDPRVALEAIRKGAAGSWALENMAPRVLSGDFKPGFKIKLHQKDLRIALDEAREMSLPLIGTSLVHQLYRILESGGEGDSGNQALIRALEKIASFQLPRESK